MTINEQFWKDKRVFLTGHTGFKGSWLSLWLQLMGAKVKGYSLSPPTSPSLFDVASVAEEMVSEIGDIRDLVTLKLSIERFNPDILIHMAAQPLVRYSYREPVETYATNVMGTVHVLESAKSCPNIRAIINVTTDKCYENQEWLWGYRENEPMGGHDPYSSSKGCAELISAAYRRSFFHNGETGLATVRAGNVIGGGDWAEDRLIPDILRAIEKNEPVIIRNPKSTRPWQHVLEPLSGYLSLAEKLYLQPKEFSEGWNFGPNDIDAKPVDWILNQITKLWPGAVWKPNCSKTPHETRYLKLDISKAREQLGWSPTWSLQQTLNSIINWHQCWLSGEDMKKHCQKEILDFVREMNHEKNS